MQDAFIQNQQHPLPAQNGFEKVIKIEHTSAYSNQGDLFL